jgi:hypothetical protein
VIADLDSEAIQTGAIPIAHGISTRSRSRSALPLVVLFSRLRALPFLHSLSEQVFDLAIHTAQLVRGPRFEFAPKLGIDAEKEGFAVFGRHDVQSRRAPSHASGNITSGPQNSTG